jgi:hypothetical protein
MHILIGLVVVAALLYFWLVAHWFARVLMFLLLGVGGFFGGGAITGTLPSSVILGVLGIVAAWYVAGIPTYYWQRRNRLWV